MIAETKKCTKCGEVKPLDSFYADGKKIQSRCKSCMCKYTKEWKKRFPEKNKSHERTCSKNKRNALTSAYIAGELGLNVSSCPPELIALKREKIQLLRLTKQLNQAIKDAQK